jgi:hypothetical protein
VELEPVSQQSVMPKNLLGCLGRFSPQQIDLIIIALAAYRALPPEQLKREWLGQIGLSSPQVVKGALINGVRKGHLTFREAQEIASIIGVSARTGS